MILTRERQSPALSPIRNRNRNFVERPALINNFEDLSKAVLLEEQATYTDGKDISFLSPAYYESNVAGVGDRSALRDLATRLINAQEEERRRIARDLHDDLSQEIALLSIHLEQLSKSINGPESIKQCCLNLQDHVREISKNIYRLSYSLHPSKLEHFGLTAAINGLCQQFSTGGLEVEFDQKGSASDLPKDVTLCVFRIVQESLRNCVKHSGSNTARVSLAISRKVVRLTISDQGKGFEMLPETMECGLGFTSMRERAMIVGGNITIHSKRKHGTSVDVVIPLVSSISTSKAF